MNYFGLSKEEFDARGYDIKTARFLAPMPPVKMAEDIGEGRIVSFVDVETTGLDTKEDEIIELSWMHCSLKSPDDMLEPISRGTIHNEPSKRITKEITELTGIDDDMVKGKSISREDLKNIFGTTDVAIAHRAWFDRKFLIAHGLRENLIWGCSVYDIDWQAKAVGSASLGSLMAQEFGFYMEHHKSIEDVYASYYVCENNLKEMFGNIFKRRWNLSTGDSSFENKDILKDAGFAWEPKTKRWWKSITEEDGDAMKTLIKKCGGTYTELFIPHHLRFD